MKEKFNKFSVPLGLLDYLNPCFYTITMITIINNIYSQVESPYPIILLVGSILSIFFGFIIPTGKVIVGLGIIKFKMPISLVFLVNLGILLSGGVLLKYSMNLNSILLLVLYLIVLFSLFLIYQKSKKMNTIAVLIGAFGYLFTYISLINLSIKNNKILPIILFAVAILLFLLLCGIGIRANLKNPKVHWIIEISNVVCQLLVMIGTLSLF